MKINFVYGVLPFFVVKSDKTDWGKTRGVVVHLPEGHDKDSPLYAHERHHMRQRYAQLLSVGVACLTSLYGPVALAYSLSALSLLFILYNLTKYGKLSREIGAYAETIRVQDGYTEALAKNYAYILVNNPRYNLGSFDVDKVKQRILKAVDKKSLFG